MSYDWTWEEISTDWLGGGLLAIPPVEVIAAFNIVERVLGSQWIEDSRTHSGVRVRGTHPTLSVVTVGQVLASLQGVTGSEKSIERLRQGDDSAFAELTAIHLIRSAEAKATVEMHPVVQVGVRQRRPDFRLRLGDDEQWTYVEVAQPDIAEAQTKAQAVLNRFADLVGPIKRNFALEIFFRREPTESEINMLAEFVPGFCLLEGDQSKDFAALAILSLNSSAPSFVVPLEHLGEPNVPRLGCAKGIAGPDEPRRHISVRMAYADDRAEHFLRKEAKQLPIGAPSLIMVQMSRTPGGIESWEPVLKCRFQPTLHTRVSAACLFRSGHELTPDGEAWVPEIKLIPNPHAALPLPPWMIEAFKKTAPQHAP
jgi:hypothetical protein